jgi:hypothetical protein
VVESDGLDFVNRPEDLRAVLAMIGSKLGR